MALVAGLTAWVTIDAGDDSSPPGGTTRVACTIELPTGSTAPQVGSAPPQFVLRALDRSCVDLASYRGRPVVINFWASWCRPCRDEFPMFRRALDRYSDQGLEILGVIHDDIASDARRFAREENADWPLLLDETDATARAYGVGGIPQTFFIDRKGVVTAHLLGLSERDFMRELRQILEPSV